jgi:hypothetical protein
MSRRSPYTNALALPGGKWTPHDLRRSDDNVVTLKRRNKSAEPLTA